MKDYKFKINDNNYAVKIKAAEGNEITLEVNGTSYVVEMEKEVKTSKTPTLARRPTSVGQPKAAVKAPNAGGAVKKVEAPLPGVIINVVAKEGDTVKVGDTLMTMEAMKMENTILAEVSGTITAVKVNPQQSVLQGDILVEIA
ncbi:biotin/lipoyl-containing protein [Persicobacter psychrovividus]|uniref:Acetyl-CoA carboxylase biotin carboxyl carrier protein subunit n=1 Tax=Persicobacter psychrovividus TaxID=387638 RepID=A0ABN6LEK9_9BACT|nr:acetyl-CoA carboxylase biotin carboxyl carrier protein subunit [Persicobacter psychrovividus]